MKKNIGWHDGKWGNIDTIKISIKDRGLKFSDGLFETILIRNNQAILVEEHIKRLNKSLELLEFKVNLDLNFLGKIINEGIKKLSLNNNEYGSIRINYSRGLNNNRKIKVNETFTSFKTHNLWLEFYVIHINLDPISVNISKTEKRNEFSLLSRCKTFAYNQSIQALIEANKNNYDDALMLNTNNELCCGTTFNILLKRGDIWLTPRKESGCLPGIMINKLLKLKLAQEDYLLPVFNKDDILLAINSLSCKQIKRVNDYKLNSYFDINNFWNSLYN